MKNYKEVKISFWASHLTTTVSVTLVLVIIGVIALLTVGAATETRRLKERLEVSVIMIDNATDAAADSLAAHIRNQDYALGVAVVSREEALKNWKNDTGEDLEALFGVNPFSPEVKFTITSNYANEESLQKIGSVISSLSFVEGVALPDAAMVDGMNRNIERFSLLLGVIAIVMIVISFLLINNTVHLAVYSRRFTIHTMQLVGATDSFIRRPYVGAGMMSGMVAGLMASALLALVVALAPGVGVEELTSIIGWDTFSVIAVSLVIIGMLLCSVASWLATTRYLRRDYDDLFK